MQRHIKDEAIVLKSYSLNENDKIFSFITKKNGIIKAVAKSIRKTKSKLSGKIMPFLYINAMFYKGKSDLYYVKEVEIIKPFPLTIMKNYDFYTVSNILIEISERINYWSQNESMQFLLLKGALQDIYNEANNTKVILNAFFIKSLYLAGVYPHLKNCVYCQKTIDNNIIYFSNKQGGLVCKKCQQENSVFVKSFSIETMKLIGKLINSKWEKALKFSNQIQKQTLLLLSDFTQYQLENKIKSLKHLNIYE